MSYLEVTKDVCKKAAESPDIGLCCTTSPIWKLPELTMPVCDKTAGALADLQQPDIYISESTFFYDGGGCC